MSSFEIKSISTNEDNFGSDTTEELEKIFLSSNDDSQELEVSQCKKKKLTKKRKKEDPDKITKKQLLEQKRELKKLEKEKEKALKMTLKDIKKSTSKEHCIKYIIVNLDESFEQESYGEIIKTTLTDNNIMYKSVKSSPGTISWSRKTPTLENTTSKENVTDEKHYLLILSLKSFESLVKAKGLTDHIEKFSQRTNFEHLTVVVSGTECPSRDQERAVLKVELMFKCYWNYVNNPVDLASFVMRASKALAQIPYSLEQEEKYKLQYFDDSNKSKVKVDKDGNGLDRLWKQMLTMFPGVRLETAEAVDAKYPTLSSLLKAYEECENKEKLLQDLPRRNHQGLSDSSKRIGPELSKKFAKFFTSEDDIVI